MELNKIYCGDCIEIMKDIPDNFIDLIVTSPPYNIGEGGVAFKFKGYDVYNDNNSDYDKFIITVLNECYRILKPSGSLMFNHKVRTVNKEIIHPLRLIFQSKFKIKQEIIWDLHDTHIHNKDRFYPINEMIYWCIKDKTKTKFNSEYAELTTVWRINRANKKTEGCNHPAPFTLEIPKRCIESLTNEGDIVFDPFVGSGTTAVASKMLNRNFIGAEISPRYVDLSNKRIREIAS